METQFIVGADTNQAVRAFFDLDVAAGKSASGIERGFNNAGKATSNFTGFIREARQEHRLQSFVMQQGIHTVNGMAAGMLALNNSMGSTNGHMKELTQSITQGFLAFQGLEFALSALGAGPWGVAAAAAVGLVVAFTSMGKEAVETAKHIQEMNDKIVDLEHILGRKSERAFVDDLRMVWISAKENLDNYVASEGRDSVLLKQYQLEELEAFRKYDEARKGMHEKQTNRTKEAGKVLKTAMEESKKAIEANSNALNDNIALLRAYTKLVAPDLFKKPANKFGDVDEHGNPIWKSDSGPVSFEALSKAMKEIEKMSKESSFTNNLINDFQNIGFSGANAAHLIAGSMQNAASMMTDAFFGASITIGDIFKNLFHDIVQMAIESLFKSLVLKVLGGAIGGGSPAGDSGWNSLNLGKAATVRQRTELAQRVHEAIVKGKAY